MMPNNPCLAAGARARMARIPGLDERDIGPASGQIQCGPATKSACANDDDAVPGSWLGRGMRKTIQRPDQRGTHHCLKQVSSLHRRFQ